MTGQITPVYLAENADAGAKNTYAHLAGFAPQVGLGYGLVVENGTTTADTGDPGVPLPTTTTGLVWVQKATIIFGSGPKRRLSWFVASKASGLSGGTVGVEYHVGTTAGALVQQGYSLVQLYAFPGADAGVDGANLMGQALVTSADTGVNQGSLELTLGSSLAADSIGFAVFATARASRLNPAATPTPVWNELHETYLGGGKNTSLMAMWNDGSDTSAKAQVRTEANDADYTARLAGIVMELKAAPTGSSSGTPDAEHLWSYDSSSALSTYGSVGDNGGGNFAAADGEGYLLAVLSGYNAAGTSEVPVPTGYGRTWTLVRTVEWSSGPLRRLSVFRSLATSGSTTGRLSITFAGQSQFHLLADLYRVNNPSASGSNGAGFVVQHNGGGQTVNATAVTASLPLDRETNTQVLALGAVAGLNGTMRAAASPPTMTELADHTVASGKNAVLAGYEWHADDTTDSFVLEPRSLDGLSSSSSKSAWIILELRGGAGETDELTGSDTLTLTDAGLVVRADDTDDIVMTEAARLRVLTPTVLPPSESVSALVDLIVEVRGPDLEKIGQVVNFDSFTMTLRHQDISTWSITLGSTEPMAPELTVPGNGIVVRRKGLVIFSGPMLTYGYDLDEGDPSGPTPELMVTAGGPDDTVMLTDRVVHPQPSTEVPPYNVQGYDVRQGPGESLMWGYVNDNLGPNAVPARRHPLLDMEPDLGRGAPESTGVPAIVARGRWQSLLELCQEVARQTDTDLGFRIVQLGVRLVFQVYEPTDRTDTAVFSQGMGNLVGFHYGVVAPVATHVYLGAQGEAEQRLIVEASDSGAEALWGRRSERFVDRRDVSDPDEAEAASTAGLAELRQQVGLQLAAIDTPGLLYGPDYDRGDRVRAVFLGVDVRDVLRQVTLTYVASESDPAEVVTPTVGTEDGVVLPSDQQIVALRRNVNRLNRS